MTYDFRRQAAHPLEAFLKDAVKRVKFGKQSRPKQGGDQSFIEVEVDGKSVGEIEGNYDDTSGSGARNYRVSSYTYSFDDVEVDGVTMKLIGTSFMVNKHTDARRALLDAKETVIRTVAKAMAEASKKT